MSQTRCFTGKYGRGMFYEESEKMFEQSVAEKKPLAVVQLDLDNFQAVNKQFGYDVGDIVIQRTQNELASVLHSHKYSSVLERRGGDEFSMTVQAGSIAVSKLVTKCLNRVIEIDYSDIADDLKVSITAGIALLNKNTKSYSELLQNATITLYQTKRSKHTKK